MGAICAESSSSLAPGFRFHPTDEELVFYYLRRKVCGKPFRFDAISDIDVYKSEPWDLPGLSKLKTRDLEWYFFSNLGNKYGNGSRTNRATSEGYWKTTGKDRPVHHRDKVVGMKKTLVYHHGRAPRGERSNWVMHEYKLVGEGLDKEPFVLCRIFHKSGSGPKNGEKYGAPFVEEEWEEDDCEVNMPSAGEVIVSDLSEENYFNKVHAVEIPSVHSIPPLNFYQGDSSNFAKTLAENELNSLTVVNEEQFGQETNDQKVFNLPVQLEPQVVNNEFAVQPTDIASQAPLTYMQLGEQCLQNVNTAPSDEGFYLEANDLLEPIEENSSDFQLLDEYLGYFDADNDFGECLPFDSSDMLDVDDMLDGQAFITDQIPPKSIQQIPDAFNAKSASSSEQVMVARNPSPGDDDIGQYLIFDSSDFLDADSVLYNQDFLTDQNLDQSIKEPSAFYQQLPEAYSASSESPSEQVMLAENFKRDSQYSFMKQASQMLGSFPAGPAFASEFPTKDMAAKLNSAMQPTESVRAAAARDNGMCWSLDKCGNFNVSLSFNLEGIVNPAGVEAITGMLSRKMTSVTSRGWFYFLFFSVLVFCISSRVDTCIHAR